MSLNLVQVDSDEKIILTQPVEIQETGKKKTISERFDV